MIRTKSVPFDRLSLCRSSGPFPSSCSGRDRSQGRFRRRPAIESLECRVALSGSQAVLSGPAGHLPDQSHNPSVAARSTSSAMTIAMPGKANGVINGVATQRMMVVRGQTLPGARVALEIGNVSRTTRAGLEGQLRVPGSDGAGQLRRNSPRGRTRRVTLHRRR